MYMNAINFMILYTISKCLHNYLNRIRRRILDFKELKDKVSEFIVVILIWQYGEIK